ncbi:MAG: AAA family ATPase [Nannocystaceae bacterium]
MRTLGLLNPRSGAGKTMLAFNLGWVLADAGLRVVLVDLDPQAALTELAGASLDRSGSIYDALAPLLDGDQLGEVSPIALGPALSLIRGHLGMSVLDDALLLAWTHEVAGSRARSIKAGIHELILSAGEHADADVVLCDLGSSLGPLVRSVVEGIDGTIVPLEPSTAEVVLAALAASLPRWGTSTGGPGKPLVVLGHVLVASSGSAELDPKLDSLGTIRRYPGLASMARSSHRPEVDLTVADGAMGSHLQAVRDLRTQFEQTATAIARRIDLVDEDLLLDDVGQALLGVLRDEMPSELESLSSRTTARSVDDVEIEHLAIHGHGLRLRGTVSISVGLEWGGGEARDGVELSASFPARFDVQLDRSREAVTFVHHLEVDTSAWSA